MLLHLFSTPFSAVIFDSQLCFFALFSNHNVGGLRLIYAARRLHWDRKTSAAATVYRWPRCRTSVLLAPVSCCWRPQITEVNTAYTQRTHMANKTKLCNKTTELTEYVVRTERIEKRKKYIVPSRSSWNHVNMWHHVDFNLNGSLTGVSRCVCLGVRFCM